MMNWGKAWIIAGIVVLGLALATPVAADQHKGSGNVLKEAAKAAACQAAPDPLTTAVCQSPDAVKNAAEAATDAVGSVASKAVETVATSFITAWTAPAREMAEQMIKGVWKAISAVEDPDVQANSFMAQYNKLLGLELLLLGPIFLAGLIMGLWPLNGRRLMNLCTSTLKAVVIGFTAPALAQLAVMMADQMTVAVTTGLAEDRKAFADNLGTLLSFNGPALGVLFTTWVIAVEGYILFGETVARLVCIYIAVAFAPLALLGSFMGDWGRSLGRKLLYFLAGIIFAKPLVAMTLVIGMGISASLDGDAVMMAMVKWVLSVVIVGSAMVMPFVLMWGLPRVVAKVQDNFQDRSERHDTSPGIVAATGAGLVQQLVQKIPGSESPLVPLAVGATAGPPAGAVVGVLQSHLHHSSSATAPEEPAPVRVESHLEQPPALYVHQEVPRSLEQPFGLPLPTPIPHQQKTEQ